MPEVLSDTKTSKNEEKTKKEDTDITEKDLSQPSDRLKTKDEMGYVSEENISDIIAAKLEESNNDSKIKSDENGTTIKVEEVNIGMEVETDTIITDDAIEHGEETELEDILKHVKEEDKYKERTCQLPDFAVIYSYLEIFGPLLELPPVSISDLEHAVDYTKEFLAKEKGEENVLEMLHIKLFRKLNKSNKFSYLSNVYQGDRLFKTVLKFCYQMKLDYAWDLQQYGYHILSSAQKLTILKTLCEIQFDENARFRTVLQETYKTDPGAMLRLLPFGFEREGLNVWFHEDADCNVRVYAGDEDDEDTWKVRAASLEDLEEYISILKGQCEVNPKDIAAEKIRQRRTAKQEEKEKRRKDREEKRKAEEEKQKTKKTRGKNKKEVDVKSESNSSSEEDDGCARCYVNNQSNLVLLCDGCDAAYHTLCLRPPIMTIPEGDWFCPYCQQLDLVEKLAQKCTQLKSKLKLKDRASKRMNFYGIRTANILAEAAEGTGRRAAREKKIDYSFTDFDQMIKDATRGGASSAKPARVRTEPSRQSQRGSRRRRFNAMDSDEEDYTSDDSDYAMSDSDHKADRIRDFIADDDFDEIEERTRNKYLRRSKRKAATQRRSRGLRKRYQDDEDDEGSEKTSDNSDDDGVRRSRRILKKGNTTNYKDTWSDDEEVEQVKVKTNEDDGGEWRKSDDDDEPAYKEDEYESEATDEKDNLYSDDSDVDTKKRVSPRKKRCKVMRFDDSDDDEEEIPYAEESENEDYKQNESGSEEFENQDGNDDTKENIKNIKNEIIVREQPENDQNAAEDNNEIKDKAADTETNKKPITNKDTCENEIKPEPNNPGETNQENKTQNIVKTDSQKADENAFHIKTEFENVTTNGSASDIENMQSRVKLQNTQNPPTSNAQSRNSLSAFTEVLQTFPMAAMHHPKLIHATEGDHSPSMSSPTYPAAMYQPNITTGASVADIPQQHLQTEKTQFHQSQQLQGLQSPLLHRSQLQRLQSPQLQQLQSPLLQQLQQSPHLQRPAQQVKRPLAEYPMQGIYPRRPTPNYSSHQPYYPTISGGQDASHAYQQEQQQQLSQMNEQFQYQQGHHRSAQPVPTSKFYQHGGVTASWNPYNVPRSMNPAGWPYAQQQYLSQSPNAYSPAVHIPPTNSPQGKGTKKLMKLKEKQEKELKKQQKLREREQKKQSKTVQPFQQGSPAPQNTAKSMNYFRNMVISADGNSPNSYDPSAGGAYI